MKNWSMWMLVLSCAVAGTAFAGERGTEAVGRVADEVCAIVAVETLSEGVTGVDFVLRPEPGSNIRCRAELPPTNKWDGRFWGVGNSGYGGKLPVAQLAKFVRCGFAAVTTDLGTGDYTDGGRSNRKVWPTAVRRDYDWRATHLMTVYGKRIVESFYGKAPHHSYFCGGSCGSRQGIGEAIRFPADYDGVLAYVVGNSCICKEADIFALYKQTHDDKGDLLLTADDLRVVSDAAIQYWKGRDERPYDGKILSDPFFAEKDIDGFLATAAGMSAKLGNGDLRKRLRELYLGKVHNGRRVTHGEVPGAYLGKQLSWIGHVYMPQYLQEKGVESLKDLTWDDFEDFARKYGPSYNACSDDLDAFRARGGKLIATAGLEDQTDPCPAGISHFERVVRRAGGDLAGVQGFYRLFVVPGCAHGGGKGRAMTVTPTGPKQFRQLIAWREEGVAPERFETVWKSENLEMPVAPYPERFVQDGEGRWVERTFDRKAIREPDPLYLQCSKTPWL